MGAWPSDRAATRLEQKGSAPSTKIADADIDEWVARLHDGIRHLARHNYQTAIQELKKTQVLSRKASHELNREQVLAQNVLDTCLYMVRVLRQKQTSAHAPGTNPMQEGPSP